MEVRLIRTQIGFIAATPADEDAMTRIKNNDQVRVEMKKERNPIRHRKFFVMLNVGFEAWEPPSPQAGGVTPIKNLERFRKDCIILAGYYEPVTDLNGDTRLEAKSMSFASMDETEFDQLYSNVADVILQRVLTTYTRSDLDAVVEEILGLT